MCAAVTDSARSTSIDHRAARLGKRKRDDDTDAHARASPQPRNAGHQELEIELGAHDGSSMETQRHCRYASDTSFILIGMAGAGKSTLAVMGALAMGRRYVDFQDYFQKHTGSLPSQYIEQHGLEDFRRMDLVVTQRLVAGCSTNCIIGGLSGNELYAHGQILRDVASTIPVIYVHRDVDDLRPFVPMDDAVFAERYQKRDKFYRSCSVFDFYNLRADAQHRGGSQGSPTLKLKDLETDFVRFLHRILNLPNKLMHSATPLSADYTYALTMRSTWLTSTFDYEELECGADAINLVVDMPPGIPGLHNRIARQVAVLRRHSRAPIIFEQRRPQRSRSTHFSTVELASRNLCEMVVLDVGAKMSSDKEMPSLKPRPNVIASIEHDLSWEAFIASPEWLRARTEAQKLDCAAIRLSNGSSSSLDNLGNVALVRKEAQNLQMPLIAYNTSRSGRTSICFNRILSPVVPQSYSSEGVTIKQAQCALHSCFVLPKQKFYIFGKSVSYSLSPAMHNAAYERLGLPHEYDYIESANFADIHALFRDEDCRGVAVTLPYKSEVLPLLDHVSEEARQIGAVNTVIIERCSDNGTGSQSVVLHGYNTDHIGIRECIYRNISPANSIRSSSSVLIIGAGGMARAALYACRELGIKRGCVWNRTQENAESLIRSVSWAAMELVVLESEEAKWPTGLSQPTTIISTIPAHRLDQRPAHELDIPSNWLESRTGGVFIELAYKPLITRFVIQMQSMASHGWVIVDGLDVLLEQGIAQFELFTGRPAPLHIMRHTIREQYSRVSTPQRPSSGRRDI